MSLKTQSIYSKYIEQVVKECGLTCSKLVFEISNSEYGAAKLKIHGKNVIFRVAKTTPKKTGWFVTFWVRNNNRIIRPYDDSDNFDVLVIFTKDNDRFCHFVFSKSQLIEKDIVSLDMVGGKLGFRVYAPWDKPLSKQAKKTQEWQSQYFLDLSFGQKANCDQVKKMYQN